MNKIIVMYDGSRSEFAWPDEKALDIAKQYINIFNEGNEDLIVNVANECAIYAFRYYVKIKKLNNKKIIFKEQSKIHRKEITMSLDKDARCSDDYIPSQSVSEFVLYALLEPPPNV